MKQEGFVFVNQFDSEEDEDTYNKAYDDMY